MHVLQLQKLRELHESRELCEPCEPKQIYTCVICKKKIKTKNWFKVVLVMGQWSWFFSICIVTFKKATPITKILNGKVPTSPNDSLACALVHLGASVLEFCWVLSVKSMQSSLYKTNSILLSLVKYQMSGHLVCLADTVCQDIMAIY